MSAGSRLSLDAIGIKHGTDKSSPHHNYLNFYESFFYPQRDEPISILEIGILDGASLRTWEEYFQNATITGVDINPITRKFERGRVKVQLGDQSNIQRLTDIALQHGPFDLIIEDGSHMWEHQITSLRTLFPFLNDNGIYIVEDLQTNYGEMRQHFKGIASESCVSYLKEWLDLCVADDQIPIEDVEDAFLRTYGRSIQFMTFYRRACLIQKQIKREAVALSNYASEPLRRESVGLGVETSLLAHIADRGDVLGNKGFVDLGADELTIQGIIIYVKDDLIDCRVRGPDGEWSAWCPTNHLAGTRGQSKELTGLTVRLRDEARSRYALRVFARFSGSTAIIEASDGADCVSPVKQGLCGVQVELIERGQPGF